jgi:hypothetical protein
MTADCRGVLRLKISIKDTSMVRSCGRTKEQMSLVAD